MSRRSIGPALGVWSLLMAAAATNAAILGWGEVAIGGAGACIVGAFLVWKGAGRRIGALLAGFGSAAVLSDWSSAVLEPGRLDEALVRPVAVLGSSVFVLVGTLANALLMVFPSGAPRPRWRWPLRILLAIGAVGTIAGLVWALGRPTADLVTQVLATGDSSNPADMAAGLVFMAFFPLAIASLFFRYRAAGVVERHQIRWLLLAAATVFTITMTQNVVGDYDSRVASIAVAFGFLLFPVASGVAILRYRLFEIDRIISRRSPTCSSSARWSASTP